MHVPSGAATGIDQDDLREPARHETRNFLALAAYQVVLRTGWIFKTESVIMPAFLDLVAGPNAGWLRGCLPVLNRFGQSIPPLLYARRLKVMPRKTRALWTTSLSMGLPFLVLALLCFGQDVSAAGPWMPYVFLALYGVFFVAHGLNQLVLGTVQGKLIAAQRRGRLMSVASATGSVSSIVFAVWLLDRWLSLPDGGFGYIFFFTSASFLLGATFLWALVEPPDAYHEPRSSPWGQFAAAGRILRQDAQVRRLAVVAGLYSTVHILFPHYQALGRMRLQLPLEELMLWVVVQNVGTGAASLLIGPLADARGNRLTLRLLIFAAALSPLLAIGLAHLPAAAARDFYFLVFLPIGLSPVALRTFQNYTLEIAPRSEHPRYLGTVQLCLAAPFVVSPLVGLIIDAAGYDAVFLAGSAVIVLAGLLSLRLAEPRHAAHHAVDLPPQ